MRVLLYTRTVLALSFAICIISLMVASVEVKLQRSVWMFTVRRLLMRLFCFDCGYTGAGVESCIVLSAVIVDRYYII